MRYVAMLADDGLGSFTDIARISAQVLCYGFGGFRLMGDLAVEHCSQLADIVAVGTDQREAKRHAFLIHQQMPSGAVFFPGPSGFCPHHHCQSEP